MKQELIKNNLNPHMLQLDAKTEKQTPADSAQGAHDAHH